MVQLFNEEGQLVDALTPEEVEARLDEVRQQAIEEANASRQEEIDDLTLQVQDREEERKRIEAELLKEKDKDKNLGGQRRVIEAKEKEIDELTKKIDNYKTEIDKKIGDIEGRGKEKTITEMIMGVAEDNKELADKIRFWYESFKGEPASEEETKQRIQNAYTLATGGKRANIMSGSLMSSAGSLPVINPSGEKLSPDVQDLAHKMGINDQSLKKHKLI
jgi:uncharacterized protein (DUF3084 family)